MRGVQKAGNKRTVGGNYERVRGRRTRKITEKQILFVKIRLRA